MLTVNELRVVSSISVTSNRYACHYTYHLKYIFSDIATLLISDRGLFQVLDEYIPDYKLSVETYCALTLVPLVLICQIRNLKWLVPFSAIANVFLVICFAITMYYIFSGLPKPDGREMVASVSQWPLFIR